MNNQISRRSVLRQATAGLTGLAAPYVIPSGVLARSGKPGANDRIVLGGIGVRRMGGALIRRGFARFDHVRIAAVADADMRVAQAIAQPRPEDERLVSDRWVVSPEPPDLRNVALYHDYRELLDRQDIDAVVIATPEHWHALPCIQAAQAGKDIYCEKPLARTIREGRRIVDAVRKYNRVFQTGTQRRSAEEWYTACMLVRNGRLGKVARVIDLNYASPFDPPMPSAQDIPEGLDWDMWCGPVQLYPFHRSIQGDGMSPGLTYRSYRDFAGANFTCTGSHFLDMVQWGLGMDCGGPVEVWTEGEPFDSKTRRAPPVFMRYPGDVILECTASSSPPRFVGENGTLTVQGTHVVSDPPELAQEPLVDPEVELYHSTNHYQDWLECIRERRQPVADVEIGHRSVAVAHLGNIARWVSERTGQTGQRLQWDVQAERFTNSDVANEFLERPSRKPYQLPEQI